MTVRVRAVLSARSSLHAPSSSCVCLCHLVCVSCVTFSSSFQCIGVYLPAQLVSSCMPNYLIVYACTSISAHASFSLSLRLCINASLAFSQLRPCARLGAIDFFSTSVCMRLQEQSTSTASLIIRLRPTSAFACPSCCLCAFIVLFL